ncbi:MAG: hypothetical protein JJV94_06325 [Sulfurospirillum sp.]|nr:hypothetical protein [Sulfurospirillum sp.]
MFSLNNIVLPEKLESKLSFLSNYSVEFGAWAKGITGSNWTMIWLILGFILLLVFKNSTEKLDDFKLNYKTALWSGIAFSGGVLSLNKVSEFLYFNF